MPHFTEILQQIAFPLVVPARVIKILISKLSSISDKEKDEKSVTENVMVIVPRKVTSLIIKDFLIEKIQSETGAILDFKYRILTVDKIPHSISISGPLEMQQRAKQLVEEAVREAELEMKEVKIESTYNVDIKKEFAKNQESSTKWGIDITSLFEDFVQVDVKRIGTPEEFLVKIINGKWKPLEKLLKDFAQNLESECVKKELSITDPQIGDVVAFHEEDENGLVVHRAMVELILPERGLIELMFVDSGEPRLIEENKHLYKLSPDLLNFPHQTIECGLANIEPPEVNEGTDERWTEGNSYLFNELCFYRDNLLFAKAVTVSVTENNSDGQAAVKPWVQLWEFGGEMDVNIGDEYVKWGQARHIPSSIN